MSVTFAFSFHSPLLNVHSHHESESRRNLLIPLVHVFIFLLHFHLLGYISHASLASDSRTNDTEFAARITCHGHTEDHNQDPCLCRRKCV